jgi:hypothetical protein
MKTVFAAAAFLWTAFEPAGALMIRSPNSAQTYSAHSIQWEQLRWLPRERAFVASITFSNLDYESRDEPRRDERFDFFLPGVSFDERKGIFYAFGKGGERIPVAAIAHELIGKEIKLLPGSTIQITTRSGKVAVALTTNGNRSGQSWIERGL